VLVIKIMIINRKHRLMAKALEAELQEYIFNYPCPLGLG